MGCQFYDQCEGGAGTFTVAMPKYTFGRGCLAEAGPRAAALGMKKVAFFTDPFLLDGPYVATAKESLEQTGLSVDVFATIRIEPDDDTVSLAAKFLQEGSFDGVVSVGGGSVIDTAKAAMVYARYPAAFTDYFGAPVGAGKPVPGPVLPHLACPTTSGTGSECTSVFYSDEPVSLCCGSRQRTRVLFDVNGRTPVGDKYLTMCCRVHSSRIIIHIRINFCAGHIQSS